MEGITTLLGKGADHDKNLGNVLGAGAARRDGFVRQHQLKIECIMKYNNDIHAYCANALQKCLFLIIVIKYFDRYWSVKIGGSG